MFKIFSTYISLINTVYKLQRLEVSVAVRPIEGSLDVKLLRSSSSFLRLLPHLPVTSIPLLSFLQ
jgi:hypothetical protein